MSSFLLDPKVVSELTKVSPEHFVVSFLSEQPDLWISLIVVHEWEFGIQKMPEGQRHNRLSEAYSHARRSGRMLKLGDACMAGTAKTNNMAIVTRDVKDFDGLDVEIVNPWEYS